MNPPTKTSDLDQPGRLRRAAKWMEEVRCDTLLVEAVRDAALVVEALERARREPLQEKPAGHASTGSGA